MLPTIEWVYQITQTVHDLCQTHNAPSHITVSRLFTPPWPLCAIILFSLECNFPRTLPRDHLRGANRQSPSRTKRPSHQVGKPFHPRLHSQLLLQMEKWAVIIHVRNRVVMQLRFFHKKMRRYIIPLSAQRQLWSRLSRCLCAAWKRHFSASLYGQNLDILLVHGCRQLATGGYSCETTSERILFCILIFSPISQKYRFTFSCQSTPFTTDLSQAHLFWHPTPFPFSQLPRRLLALQQKWLSLCSCYHDCPAHGRITKLKVLWMERGTKKKQPLF